MNWFKAVANNKSNQANTLGFFKLVQWRLNCFSLKVIFLSQAMKASQCVWVCAHVFLEEPGVKSSSLSSVFCTFVHLVLSWNRARNAKGYIYGVVRTESTLKEKELLIYVFVSKRDCAVPLLSSDKMNFYVKNNQKKRHYTRNSSHQGLE